MTLRLTDHFMSRRRRQIIRKAAAQRLFQIRADGARRIRKPGNRIANRRELIRIAGFGNRGLWKWSRGVNLEIKVRGLIRDLTDHRLMMSDMIRREGLDEVITVIVPFVAAQSEFLPRFRAGRLEQMGMKLTL